MAQNAKALEKLKRANRKAASAAAREAAIASGQEPEPESEDSDGSGSGSGEEVDSDDGVEEDDDGALLTPEVDLAVMETLRKIRKRDPSVYTGDYAPFSMFVRSPPRGDSVVTA